MNKKGSWILYLSAIGIVSALFLFLTTDILHAQPIRERLGFLGQNQLGILNADNEAQKILFYIDRAAKVSTLQTINDLAAKGGYVEPPECGEYFGYTQWKNVVEEKIEKEGEVSTKIKLKNCVNENLEADYTTLFNQNLKPIIAQVKEMPQSDYDITLRTEGTKTQVIGNARQPINLLIMKQQDARGVTINPTTPSVIPGTNRVTCQNTVDNLITIDYLDGMKVWIPAEATCGGVFPSLIFLHGNNPDGAQDILIGTGSHNGYAGVKKGRGIEQQVKKHIENGGYPVILVEPSHFRPACGSNKEKGLWGEDFDVNELIDKLRTRLQQPDIGITLASVSVAGHSGANCCSNAGMNKIVKKGIDVKLFGVIDGTCPISFPDIAMKSQSTILHISSGRTKGDQDYDKELMSTGSTDIACDTKKYKSCRKANVFDYYSFTARSTTHIGAVDLFFKEALRSHFMQPPPGVTPGIVEPAVATGFSTWAKGEACAGYIMGSIPYQQDSKIKCSKKPCCMMPETRQQIEKTKEFIPVGTSLTITSPARKTRNQRDSYLQHLGGGAPGCGPRDRPVKDKELIQAISAPKISSRSGRVKAAEDWFKAHANEKASSGHTYGEIYAMINDYSKYTHCRHVQGRAVDIRLSGKGTEQAKADLRTIMCRAGWTNLGSEWWHYEYLTKRAQKAYTDNQCYFGRLSDKRGTASLPQDVRRQYRLV